ncbi:SDR family oxidoreductase [Novosphingobium resinovorum]|uniref:Short-chain dehydrogenase n=1 Tax=Novosphingobium resinovorum TaxID=158500 RepID=A0A1D8AEK8_9SPHN|nr:SDR family oxidoreductase [Novosphingobium resinovorum]AOR80491.1 short-chain dehydrogenase [Novosphingobium resinovorum]
MSVAKTLADKVAIVTGAGGRGNSIGRAYALALAAAGARVLVADLNLEGAQAVVDEIASRGGEAGAVRVDIADPDSVGAMAEVARSAWGGVDILVNNAAMMAEITRRPLMDCPLEDWNKVLQVNLTGALNCCQAVVPMMVERGGGKIVNQVSGGAFPPMGLYGISKLALVGLTTALAYELGPRNINVNAIAPGITNSDAGKKLTPQESPIRQMLERTVAMRVDGQPEDLVGPLLLLCSDAGSWIQGQVLHVDGGWIIRP